MLHELSLNFSLENYDAILGTEIQGVLTSTALWKCNKLQEQPFNLCFTFFPFFWRHVVPYPSFKKAVCKSLRLILSWTFFRFIFFLDFCILLFLYYSSLTPLVRVLFKAVIWRCILTISECEVGHTKILIVRLLYFVGGSSLLALSEWCLPVGTRDKNNSNTKMCLIIPPWIMMTWKYRHKYNISRWNVKLNKITQIHSHQKGSLSEHYLPHSTAALAELHFKKLRKFNFKCLISFSLNAEQESVSS